MKRNCLNMCLLSVAVGGMALVSGCVIEPGRVVYAPPVVAYSPPPPVVVETAPPVVYAPPVVVGVPDSYTWDGYEYVGVVGDQYFYLGAGNVWLVCDPFRLDRFHGWERGHPDWRVHAIRNDRFRRDAHGHQQPRRDVRHDDHH
jgi:hypothetical protein